MKFSSPLMEGKLVQRYKRFFADVKYFYKGQWQMVTIHVSNTGSLKGVIEKNLDHEQNCLFSLHNDPTKKLKGTLEAIQTSNGSWVGVNTSNPNKIVYEAIQNSIISLKQNKNPFLPQWENFLFFKPEFKINSESRLDAALATNEEALKSIQGPKHFIEIKNTTYVSLNSKNKIAQFPDSVTERGQKHLNEMMKLLELGHSCELIFTVQRDDVDSFSASIECDPEYAKLLKIAHNRGVIITPLIVQMNKVEINLTNRLLPILW